MTYFSDVREPLLSRQGKRNDVVAEREQRFPDDILQKIFTQGGIPYARVTKSLRARYCKPQTATKTAVQQLYTLRALFPEETELGLLDGKIVQAYKALGKVEEYKAIEREYAHIDKGLCAERFEAHGDALARAILDEVPPRTPSKIPVYGFVSLAVIFILALILLLIGGAELLLVLIVAGEALCASGLAYKAKKCYSSDAFFQIPKCFGRPLEEIQEALVPRPVEE